MFNKKIKIFKTLSSLHYFMYYTLFITKKKTNYLYIVIILFITIIDIYLLFKTYKPIDTNEKLIFFNIFVKTLLDIFVTCSIYSSLLCVYLNYFLNKYYIKLFKKLDKIEKKLRKKLHIFINHKKLKIIFFIFIFLSILRQPLNIIYFLRNNKPNTFFYGRQINFLWNLLSEIQMIIYISINNHYFHRINVYLINVRRINFKKLQFLNMIFWKLCDIFEQFHEFFNLSILLRLFYQSLYITIVLFRENHYTLFDRSTNFIWICEPMVSILNIIYSYQQIQNTVRFFSKFYQLNFSNV